jgi:hypothetical protein
VKPKQLVQKHEKDAPKDDVSKTRKGAEGESDVEKDSQSKDTSDKPKKEESKKKEESSIHS